MSLPLINSGLYHFQQRVLLVLAMGVTFSMTLFAAPVSDIDYAKASLADGLYQNAERCLVTYLAANQTVPEKCVVPLLLLCQSVALQGRPDDVLALLDKNTGIVSVAESPELFGFWRSRSLIALGHSDEALSVIDSALTGLNNDSETALWLRRLRADALVRAGVSNAVNAAKAVYAEIDVVAAKSMSPEMMRIRSDSILDWARLSIREADTNEAERLLKEQQSFTASATNIVSAELGAIAYADILSATLRRDEARVILSGLVNSDTSSPRSRAEAFVLLASISTNGAEAAAYGDQLMSLMMPRNILAAYELRYGRAIIGKFPESLSKGAAHLQHAIHSDPAAPDASEAQLALADAWLAAGSNTLAAAEYRNFLESYTADADRVTAALRGQATAMLRLGNSDVASTLFINAAKSTTNSLIIASCFTKAADALHAAEKFSMASETYKKALAHATLAGDDALAAYIRFMTADSIERLGDVALAEREYLSLSSNSFAGEYAVLSNLRLAILLERRGAYLQAIDEYSHVITNRVSSARLVTQAYLGRGRTHYRNMSFLAAVNDFAKVPSSAPESDEAGYFSILSLYGAGRDKDAAEKASAFISDRASSAYLPSVLLWMAQYRYNNLEYEVAEKILLEYADREPPESLASAARLLAGKAAFMLAEYSRVIDIVAELFRRDPESTVAAEARLLQAKALCNLARFEDAILVLNDITARFPTSHVVTDALILKGDSLFSTAAADASGKMYSEAAAVYSNALARTDMTGGQTIECAFKLARCHDKNGADDAALDVYYNRVVLQYASDESSGVRYPSKVSEFFARAVFNAADILEKKGKNQEAINILRRLESSSLPERERAKSAIERLQSVNWRDVLPQGGY